MLKYTCNFLYLLLIHILCSTNLMANGHDINQKRFKHITSSDGLSTNIVSCILKDSRGYVWIGTTNGLNKYNIYDTKIYQPDERNSKSLSASLVFDLVEEDTGAIWVATNNGLNRFDINTELFVNYFANDNKESISSNIINSLLIENNSLWIGTNKGLDRLNIKTAKINNMLDGYPVNDIVTIKDYLWLASDSKLLRYHLHSGQVVKFALPVDNSIRSLSHYQDTLWIGTKSEGLIPFSFITNKFKMDKRLLLGSSIRAISTDVRGDTWISSTNSGLYVYSNYNNKLTKVITSTVDTSYFPSETANTLHIYNDDTLWIGSSSGISYTSLSQPIKYLRNYSKEIISNTVYNIKIDKSKSLWIGTDKGLSNYSNDKINHYDNVGFVFNIFLTNSTIWSAGQNGIYKYNDNRKKLEKYNSNITTLAKRNINIIYDIIEISHKQFLLATGSGLVFWNSDTNHSHIMPVDSEKSSPKNIITYLTHYKNNILLSTNQGIHYLQAGTQSIDKYLNSNEITTLDESYVGTIMPDGNGNLWVGTNKGIFKLRDRKIVGRYTIDHGLLDNNARSIAIANNILWVGANKGLSAFRIDNNQFRKIHLNNDQFNIEFIVGAAYKDTNNVLYFGTTNGVMYFNSNAFNKSEQLPKTTVTDFQLFNRRVKTGTDILPQSINLTDKIVLAHDQNILTFKFSSMNINNPEHLYAYQMQGLTQANEWLITDYKNRRATFTPQAGEYNFRVKSGWDNDNWSNKITEIKIIILPPWWKTLWAFCLYITIIIIGVILIYNLRIRQIRLRANQLEEQIRERTAELVKQNQKIDSQKNELTQLLEEKDRIFANISHEFRTPLTLILSPIKNMLERMNNSANKDELSLIQRNAFRLLRLVGQLLELSRLQRNEPLAANISEDSYIAIKPVTNGIIDTFLSVAKSKSLELQFSCNINAGVYCTYDDYEKILLNLISNSIKYTLPGGNINISIAWSQSNNQVVVIVRDNGVGIPDDQQGFIFERFARANGKSDEQIPGAGIGLALVTELLDKYQGEISVISELGKGSEFKVNLPGQLIEDNESINKLMLNHNTNSTQYDNADNLLLEIMHLTDSMRNEETPDRGQANDEIEENNTLLIIEDNPDMRKHITSQLCQHYQCRNATDGKEGIRKALDIIPDLIICDIMMPELSGYDVCKQLKHDERTCHIPIILLTALVDRESRLKGLEELSDDYITKPFDIEELHIRIRNLLAIREILKQQFSSQVQLSFTSDNNLDIERSPLSTKDRKFVIRFEEILKNNYHKPDFSVKEIADKTCITQRQLQRKLKALIHQSPGEYLRSYRIKKATELLAAGKCIERVSFDAGFSNRAYFSICFKAQTGMTPKQYQNEHTVVLQSTD